MGGRKRGREMSMCKRYIKWLPLACPQLGTWPETQAPALTRNQTSDLSVHRLVLNPLRHPSQGRFILLTCHFNRSFVLPHPTSNILDH